jgi:hypothetical protein
MPQLQTPQQPANTILEDLKSRMTPSLLEVLFDTLSLSDPSSLGSVEYLRQTIRASKACEANFNAWGATCDQAGMTIGRRSAFRAGCFLGLLMSQYLPITARWREL